MKKWTIALMAVFSISQIGFVHLASAHPTEGAPAQAPEEHGEAPQKTSAEGSDETAKHHGKKKHNKKKHAKKEDGTEHGM
jgi:hypothetical protein